MIGLVVATHANLAEELVATAALIIGPSHRICPVAIRQGSSVDEIQRGVARAIEQVGDDCSDVIIMTDMFGGTPSNVSISFLDPDHIEVVTGVNLPMILKFFNSPEGLSAAELARMLKAYGQQSITLASEILAS